MAGTFDPTNPSTLPGLYTRFVAAAAAAIQGGERGVVGLTLVTYSGTATAKQFYTVTADTLADANTLFGAANVKPIEYTLQGGAREVLVYTMPTIDGTTVTEASAYTEARTAFDAKDFNVFVYGGAVSATEQDAGLVWMKDNRTDGKHFMVVYGGSDADDQDPAVGNARSTRLADDYAVNLISGVIIDSAVVNSSKFAPYIAGLIAGTAINRAITYTQIFGVTDVSKRLRKSDQKTARDAGSLVLIHDGEKVKVLQGVTTSVSKIRTQRARQAINEDLERTAADKYIGKLDNNEAGRVTLIGAIEMYLRALVNDNVVANPVVGLDPNRASTGDAVFLSISFTEVDSMERIFISIEV